MPPSAYHYIYDFRFRAAEEVEKEPVGGGGAHNEAQRDAPPEGLVTIESPPTPTRSHLDS